MRTGPDDDGCCPDCGRWPCDCNGADLDVDVCQNCGGYFEWTPGLRLAWIQHWLSGREPTARDTQPQRCRRCIVDETWVETGL